MSSEIRPSSFGILPNPFKGNACSFEKRSYVFTRLYCTNSFVLSHRCSVVGYLVAWWLFINIITEWRWTDARTIHIFALSKRKVTKTYNKILCKFETKEPVWTAGKGDPNQPLNEECRRPPSWFAFRSRPMSREELIVTSFYNTGNLVGWLTDVLFYKARFFPVRVASQTSTTDIGFLLIPFLFRILLRALAQFNAVYGGMNKKGLVFLKRLPSLNKKGSPTRTWITIVVQVETTPPLQKSTSLKKYRFFKLNRSTIFHCWTRQFWGNFFSNLHVQNWINLLQRNLI